MVGNMAEHFDWQRPSDVSVVADRNGVLQRELEVRWVGPGIEVIFTLRASGRTVIIAEALLRSKTAIPPDVRRLPSDGVVVHALRTLGNRGASALMFLLDDREAVSERFQDRIDAGDDRPPDPEALERVLASYIAEVHRRPRRRIQEQIDRARDLLDAGHPTNAVVDTLMAEGASERTAYRRVKQARDD